MTEDNTPKKLNNPDNTDDPADRPDNTDNPDGPHGLERLGRLDSADVALIRAHASGSRVFLPPDPTREPYDTTAVERAVEEIAAGHDVGVADLITAVYGSGVKAILGRVEYSFRRRLFVDRQLERVVGDAMQDPAAVGQRMYEYGVQRRLIPGDHDAHAVQAGLVGVAQSWTQPDDAVSLPLLAGSDQYVVMRLREEGQDADLVQIPVAEPDTCHHGMTVCVDVDCVGSWSTDWQIIQSQSNIGKRMRYVIYEFALPPIG